MTSSARSYAHATAMSPVGRIPREIKIAPSIIPHAGNGAFTNIPLRAGDIIGEYIGVPLTSRQANRVRNANYLFNVFGFRRAPGQRIGGRKRQRVTKVVIDSADPRRSSWSRYVNAARWAEEQNSYFKQWHHRIFLVALRDIAPGEELIAHYGKHTAEIVGAAG